MGANTSRVTAPPQPELSALVFDDEPDMRNLIGAHLGRLGIVATPIADKCALTEALCEDDADLIVLDLSLGDTDALDIIALLSERAFAGRIVLISGHDAHVLHHVERLGLEAGLNVAGTLCKPFRRSQLKSLIEKSNTGQGYAFARPVAQSDPDILATAIEKDWLEFWFQPKIDLTSGQCIGAEALARIRHPEQGILAPWAFLPAADGWQLRQLAVRAASAAADAYRRLSLVGHPMPIAINIAGRLLCDDTLIEDIKAERRNGPAGCEISIEITETDVIEDKSAAERFATRAVLHGFAISIDDFGSGYATFERLRHIPFSELKLDRANVNGCARDKRLEGICRAAVELGHSFGATVVAEGVEDAADQALLKTLGYDIAQGYKFARPLPLDDLIAFVTAA